MSMAGFGSEWAEDRIARLINDAQPRAPLRKGTRRTGGIIDRLTDRLRIPGSSPPGGSPDEDRLQGRAGSRSRSDERAVPRTDASAF
jgi:hypothetical protein